VRYYRDGADGGSCPSDWSGPDHSGAAHTSCG